MIKVVLTSDTEPDRPFLGSDRLNKKKRNLTWKGIKNIKNIKNQVSSIEDDFGNCPKFTWFLMADEMIKESTGKYDYLFTNFNGLWEMLEKNGDEIGWHYHTARYKDSCWKQEAEDLGWIEKSMKSSFNSIDKKILSSRMGWTFHNNTTMKAINDLGIKVDVSASSGLCSSGNSVFLKLMNFRNGTTSSNFYDWTRAPHKAYKPSRLDYQKKGNMEVLEVPTTLNGSNWSMFSPNPLHMKKVVKLAKKKDVFLIGTSHPDETVFSGIYKLIRNYSIKNLVDNLTTLSIEAKRNNVKFEFITAKDIGV